MKKIEFKQNEIIDIVELYKNNFALSSIGKKYSVNRNVIKRILLENNIELRKVTTKYQSNTDIFKQIDTKEKAYWLGFIAADGCIYKRNNNKSGSFLVISLSRKDKNHLIKFKEFMGSNVPILDFIQDKGYSNHTEMSKIIINSTDLVNDLCLLGITNKKSLTLKPPKINPQYYLPFIKGYFDGDGSLYKIKSTNNWGLNFEGTKEMLEWIADVLHLNNKLEKRYKDNPNNNYYIRCGGNNKTYIIMKEFYESVDISLDRKLEKYTLLKNSRSK